MHMIKRLSRICLVILLLLSIVNILLIYAPDYLTYSDKPEKSDAVVLFLGYDGKARQAEVNWLLTRGYARYLLIPAYGKILEEPLPSGRHGRKAANPKKIIARLKPKIYFENTHVEILEARRMMSEYGLKSAIFVSSPYHMRRIKIITDKVFDNASFRIIFVPTRFAKFRQDLRDLTKTDWKYLGNEYLKIAWFVTYSTVITDQ